MVSQRAGLKRALEAMDLGPEHAALVAYCEGMAAQLDHDPTNGALWREYRPALVLLMSLGETESDGQAALVELVRPPVRHTEAPGA